MLIEDLGPAGRIEGHVAPGFERVAETFIAGFRDQGEVGAGVAVHLHGEPVVDLWGGIADPAAGRAWGSETPAVVYSCTKGIVAVCAWMLAQEGALDMDAPVARYWPEFAAAGKGEIPVRWLLTHEAGLSAVDARMPFGSLSDWDAMVAALAAQAPAWTPGSGHGYHGVTYGHLIGEVLRRATGRTVGTLVHEELAVPLGIDLLMPLPAEDDARTADLVVAASPEGTFFDHWQPKGLGPRSFRNPPDCSDPNHCTTPVFRRAEIPAANMHGNARALDRLYAVLARGGSVPGLDLASPELVAAFGRCHVRGQDLVMDLPTAFGLGFEHTIPEWPFGPGPRTYGHNGSGGSLGIVDPDARVSLGYAMNRLWWGPTRSDPRWDSIFDALYAAL